MMAKVATIVVVAACMFAVLDARRLLEDNQSTVVDVMKCDKTFGIIKEAAAAAGLVDALTAPDADITVFVPSNKAFLAALDKLGLTKEELLESDMLADILKYHVVPGKIKSDDIQDGESKVATLLGPDLEVSNFGNVIDINDATVQYADLEADNGIVHVIDKVLLPPKQEKEDEADEGKEDDEAEVDEAEVEEEPSDDSPVLG